MMLSLVFQFFSLCLHPVFRFFLILSPCFAILLLYFCSENFSGTYPGLDVTVRLGRCTAQLTWQQEEVGTGSGALLGRFESED